MRRARASLWLVVGALWVGMALLTPRAGDDSPQRAAVPRLLGPFANLAASVQWVRVHAARRAGRLELALARAELALRLDPLSPEGWSSLASHLAFDRGSPEREPSPARRRGFLLAGLATAARGEGRSSHPQELAYLRGIILAFGAAPQPDLEWPGGPQALWAEALEHFTRARALGHPHAAAAAEMAREERAGLRRRNAGDDAR